MPGTQPPFGMKPWGCSSPAHRRTCCSADLPTTCTTKCSNANPGEATNAGRRRQSQNSGHPLRNCICSRFPVLSTWLFPQWGTRTLTLGPSYMPRYKLTSPLFYALLGTPTHSTLMGERRVGWMDARTSPAAAHRPRCTRAHPTPECNTRRTEGEFGFNGSRRGPGPWGAASAREWGWPSCRQW